MNTATLSQYRLTLLTALAVLGMAFSSAYEAWAITITLKRGEHCFVPKGKDADINGKVNVKGTKKGLKITCTEGEATVTY